MNWLTVAVGMCLGAWLLLTVVAQVPRLGDLMYRRVALGRWAGLIPSWSFFAPNPANRDFALFYRERYQSGDLSPWREVGSSCSRKTLLVAVWNPGSRPKKAITDAA